jgi:beta-glucanase (GH16 family)
MPFMKLILSGRQTLACLSLALAITACKKESSSINIQEVQSKGKPADAVAALTYQLVWSDEFNGTSVNTSNWTFETGAGGWGNNEQQYYRSQNATVSGGNLIITAKRESFGGAQYTSARMTTQNKRSFTYGRMEARIKLPLGQGLWPAFWMLGTNIGSVGWPRCGEMDIMEHINTSNTVYGTMHWDVNGYASYGGNTNTTPASYHVYSIEWNSSYIRWMVDGVKYHEGNILNNINGTEEFHRPFFFILNVAVGGNWPGQTIDNSKLPASMYVDYVRVYQLR